MEVWTEIQDSNVRHVWQCENDNCSCTHEEIQFSPQESEIPMCQGEDGDGGWGRGNDLSKDYDKILK